MARSVEEIFNGMVATKESLSTLVGYTPQFSSQNAYQFVLQRMSSSSYVALWLLMFYVVAVAVNISETLWDSFMQEVLTLIANHRPGTLLWYRIQALNYQDGYGLVWQDNKYQYTADDSNARIVKQCSAKEVGGEIRLKVASVDASGNLIPLSAPQLTRFIAYINQIKYAGAKVVVESYSADTVRVVFAFKYDALYDLTPLQTLALQAVKDYLKSLQFNGAVNLNAIIDKLQAIPGIVDAVPVVFEAKFGALPYTSYESEGEYLTNSGYAVVDETPTGFSSSTWTAAV